MESDTTVPGDKLHDPVETPAGKREPTPVLSVAVITVTEQWATRHCRIETHLRASVAQSVS